MLSFFVNCPPNSANFVSSPACLCLSFDHSGRGARVASPLPLSPPLSCGVHAFVPLLSINQSGLHGVTSSFFRQILANRACIQNTSSLRQMDSDLFPFEDFAGTLAYLSTTTDNGVKNYAYPPVCTFIAEGCRKNSRTQQEPKQGATPSPAGAPLQCPLAGIAFTYSVFDLNDGAKIYSRRTTSDNRATRRIDETEALAPPTSALPRRR